MATTASDEEMLDASASQRNAEERRVANNVEAWRNCGGYQTTSGCPCWDRSKYVCVPKSMGFGFNPNFYVCFWWLPCVRFEAPPPTEARR